MSAIADALEINFEWLAMGRGRLATTDPGAPAERVPSDFARDEMEERILLAARQLNKRKREAVLVLMEALTR